MKFIDPHRTEVFLKWGWNAEIWRKTSFTSSQLIGHSPLTGSTSTLSLCTCGLNRHRALEQRLQRVDTIRSSHTNTRTRSLTYLGVAERVLRVRRCAGAALRQLVEVQAAEDEQQADEVLEHRLHLCTELPRSSVRAAGIHRVCVCVCVCACVWSRLCVKCPASRLCSLLRLFSLGPVPPAAGHTRGRTYKRAAPTCTPPSALLCGSRAVAANQRPAMPSE